MKGPYHAMSSLKQDLVSNVVFKSLQSSSVGEALSLYRVEVEKTLVNGTKGDPVTETWIIRHSASGDKLVAVIGLRLMDSSS